MAVVSSPSRGTWIEIGQLAPCTPTFIGRPPHGGRGLKYPLHLLHPLHPVVPLTGDVD